MKFNVPHKIMSILLAAAMVSSSALAASVPGSDISGHWARDQIGELAAGGYITADENGSYHPDAVLTVEGFSSVLKSVPGLSEALSAEKLGVSVEPSATITRETALAVLAQLLEAEPADASVLDRFRDADKVSDHARDGVAAMVAAGYVNGCGNDTLEPGDGLTLAELAALFSRTKYALAADEDGYVYGTARLTWEQFWKNEDIEYDSARAFDAANDTTDSEGATDLGGFDAVTRATAKHGVYRGSAHYSSLLRAADEAGNAVSVYLEDIVDAADVEDMYGAGKDLYGVTANGGTAYYLAQPESGAYTTYTISDFDIVGYKAWPVKVLASEAAAAAEAVNFRLSSAVNGETGLLKEVSIAADGGVSVGAAGEAGGLEVVYNGTPSVSYNNEYGDYTFIQLSDCDPEWGKNLLGAVYEFYGDVDPEADAGAQPVATYGTKYSADTWWKSSGKLLQFGINTSYRHGGSGEVGGEEQHGYWRVTIMSAGYENYSFVVRSLPAYESEVTAAIAEDNKTITISGISDADQAATTVTVDGAVVDVAAGVAVVDGLAIGSHTVAVNIDGYREITDELIVMSALTAEDITLVGNVLAVNGGDLENYLNNVTGIAVNGTTLNGNDLGNVVFQADGSVNFEAAISSRGGSTAVFPDGSSSSYMLIITSAGYPNVILNTETVG